MMPTNSPGWISRSTAHGLDAAAKPLSAFHLEDWRSHSAAPWTGDLSGSAEIRLHDSRVILHFGGSSVTVTQPPIQHGDMIRNSHHHVHMMLDQDDGKRRNPPALIRIKAFRPSISRCVRPAAGSSRKEGALPGEPEQSQGGADARRQIARLLSSEYSRESHEIQEARASAP